MGGWGLIVLIGLALASNRDRLRLQLGVLGLLSDGLRMTATPEQIRDFMIAVAKAYPKSEGWLVLGVFSPQITIKFNGKLCGQIVVADAMAFQDMVARLMSIHPEHPDGEVGGLTKYPARLIYKQNEGKVLLSASNIPIPR